MFQYTLPCGSDSLFGIAAKVLRFNTHSLAGVIQGTAVKIWQCIMFPYALPCGSDSAVCCSKQKIDFNTHSLAGVIRRIYIWSSWFISIRTPLREWFTYFFYFLSPAFQYALPCGSDSETFTKSEIKKSCNFCQIAKCSTFIITDLWKITILLSLFYKIPVGKPLGKHRFL